MISYIKFSKKYSWQLIPITNFQVIGQWVCFPDHSASSMTAEVDSDNDEEITNQTAASGPPDTTDESNASRELSAALKALKDSPVQPMPMQAFFVANSKSNWYEE